MSNPNFLNSRRNCRGGISAARLQALKDISQHQALTDTTKPWYEAMTVTASSLARMTEITYLNRQLGL